MICLFGVKAGGWDSSPWRDRLRRLRKCSSSFWGAGNFTVKDSFVLTARPWATDSTLGSQLCPGACTYPFFLFWPRASGDRLNNHPGVLPESQDEEGQEAQQETESRVARWGWGCRGSSASCGFNGSTLLRGQN